MVTHSMNRLIESSEEPLVRDWQFGGGLGKSGRINER